jgi:hypothetical protein
LDINKKELCSVTLKNNELLKNNTEWANGWGKKYFPNELVILETDYTKTPCMLTAGATYY